MVDDKNNGPEVEVEEVATEAVATAQVVEAVVKGKEIISYEDFAKLDIALGVITSVEVVEGADKLLRLLVDIGEEEPRQIV
jgi:methionyl-tRNA synthetase